MVIKSEVTVAIEIRWQTGKKEGGTARQVGFQV